MICLACVPSWGWHGAQLALGLMWIDLVLSVVVNIGMLWIMQVPIVSASIGMLTDQVY